MYTEIMKISHKDQIEFTQSTLALEAKVSDLECLEHLRKVVLLVQGWTDGRSGIIGYLDEYLYETIEIANGKEDTGWRAEFRQKLLDEINE